MNECVNKPLLYCEVPCDGVLSGCIKSVAMTEKECITHHLLLKKMHCITVQHGALRHTVIHKIIV